MAIDDKVRDQKIQYDANREKAKISALSSCIIMHHWVKYLTDDETLSSD